MTQIELIFTDFLRIFLNGENLAIIMMEKSVCSSLMI